MRVDSVKNATKNDKNERLWIFIILSLDLLFLLYSLNKLSISYYEALIYFDKQTPLHFMLRFFCTLFGQNDWALRLPFVFLHVINSLLVYAISKEFLKIPRDRLISLLCFVMLPGVNAAALIANEASLVIFISLLFIWLWSKKHIVYAYVFLNLSICIDNSFSVLYIALFGFGFFSKDKTLMFFSLALFALSMYMYGFNTHGKPRGYFLDTIAVYAAALSPLVLIYYIYTLYRIAIRQSKDLLWFVYFGAFIVCVLLSFRQRLYLEDFLPFAVIGVPLMVKVFLNSYRVRLPIHRRFHRLFVSVIVGSLFVNFLLIHANKLFYLFYENPKEHFAYKHQVAKELAFYLKKQGIMALHVEDERLRKRLRFYGIIDSDKKYLKELDLKNNSKDVFKFDFAYKHIARYKVVRFENNL